MEPGTLVMNRECLGDKTGNAFPEYLGRRSTGRERYAQSSPGSRLVIFSVAAVPVAKTFSRYTANRDAICAQVSDGQYGVKERGDFHRVAG